jgi:glutamate 5-kinase
MLFPRIARMAVPLRRLLSIKPPPPIDSARSWLADLDVSAERLPLSNARRVVVKVGTAVVSNPDGTIALSRIGALVEQLRDLVKEGRQVLLVTSGAVGLGRLKLGLSKQVVANPSNIIDRQACAATGQGVLMSTYDMMFQRLGITCSQVLITEGDFLSRERYSYLTDTLDRLTSLGVVPIINENDVVTGSSDSETHKIFSDNDKLSALVAAGADADGLALLTDVEAVFTKPPDQPGAERIKIFTADNQIIIGEKSINGRGGMSSKIAAARVAASGGVHTVVASGLDVANIKRIFAGEDIGTLFPAGPRPNKRQRWLTYATTAIGMLKVRASAKEKILSAVLNSNVLVADIISVEGNFDARAVVSVHDEDGAEFARGLVQINSEDIKAQLSPEGMVTFSSAHAVMTSQDIVVVDGIRFYLGPVTCKQPPG